jgi:hypothetical protein
VRLTWRLLKPSRKALRISTGGVRGGKERGREEGGETREEGRREEGGGRGLMLLAIEVITWWSCSCLVRLTWRFLKPSKKAFRISAGEVRGGEEGGGRRRRREEVQKEYLRNLSRK